VVKGDQSIVFLVGYMVDCKPFSCFGSPLPLQIWENVVDARPEHGRYHFSIVRAILTLINTFGSFKASRAEMAVSLANFL
jgi:hypothetical protein